MKTHAKANFSVKSWDEKTWDGNSASEVAGEKLTHASVTCTYTGDITGESQLQYLMSYRPDGSGSFVGIERIEGAIGNRSGSFILQHSGTFEGQNVKGAVFIVPGSGEGDLKTIRGGGTYDMGGAQPHYPMLLEFDL
jgi:hypothetical protein